MSRSGVTRTAVRGSLLPIPRTPPCSLHLAIVKSTCRACLTRTPARWESQRRFRGMMLFSVPLWLECEA
jgi:hypothetical protein